MMVAQKRPLHLRSVVGLLILLAGCAPSYEKPEVYRVHGVVLVDGTPKQYVNVLLTPVDSSNGGTSGFATTDESGEFEIQSVIDIPESGGMPRSATVEGIESGDYFVSLSYLKPIRPRASEPEFGDELLPEKYQKPASSGLPELKITVLKEDNELPPYQLERRK